MPYVRCFVTLTASSDTSASVGADFSRVSEKGEIGNEKKRI